tara:strand:- start:544 stop:843 length:300 start_codon:yes stop_codon:yes gene_type:complete
MIMAKCKTGQVYDIKVKKCRPYTKSEKKQIKDKTLLSTAGGAYQGGMVGAGTAGARKGGNKAKSGVAGAIIGGAITGYLGRRSAKKKVARAAMQKKKKK